MKKWVYMTVSALVAAGGFFWSCQKDEVLTSQEELMLKKAKIQQTANALSWSENLCAGEVLTFTVEGTGQKQIRMWNGVEWILLASRGNDSFPLSFDTTLVAGTYYFGYKLGSDFYPSPSSEATASSRATEGYKIEVINCGCEESFYYEKNENGSYTFSYVPEETFSKANLVFTFAQGVAVSGLDGWKTNGSTRQTTMELIACETYSWTVTLTPDCSGNSNNSNVWTDFKVAPVDENINAENEFGVKIYSKKGNLQNIVISCPE